MALIVIQAADNFSAPIRQKYPMEVIRLAAPYSHATWTVFNSEAGYVDNLCHTVTPDLKPVYVLTNTTCFHFNVFPAEATLAGETIFSYTNPLSWPPFTFDQFNTAEKREKMEKFDFRMRLVKVR
jgi:hypothetical protein